MNYLAGCAIGGCDDGSDYLGWIIAGSILLLIIIIYIVWLIVKRKKQN